MISQNDIPVRFVRAHWNAMRCQEIPFVIVERSVDGERNIVEEYPPP